MEGQESGIRNREPGAKLVNEPYFPDPVRNYTSLTFGQITASNQENCPRRVQLGVKFLF